MELCHLSPVFCHCHRWRDFGAIFPQLDLWHKPHIWRNSFYAPAKIVSFSSSPQGAILYGYFCVWVEPSTFRSVYNIYNIHIHTHTHTHMHACQDSERTLRGLGGLVTQWVFNTQAATGTAAASIAAWLDKKLGIRGCVPGCLSVFVYVHPPYRRTCSLQSESKLRSCEPV